jgi:hypothetical protein
LGWRELSTWAPVKRDGWQHAFAEVVRQYGTQLEQVGWLGHRVQLA